MEVREMKTIELLSENLANKIAAGEVVERPLSVVKELVENSIDAQSTRIHIHLKNHGMDEIRVEDNGIGIASDELEIALKRHATSKIKSEADLFSIHTMGFRGEALPSIASVSKVRLASAREGLEGAAVYSNGGILEKHQVEAVQRGTDITVAHLFYNTPARLKHIQNIYLESARIKDYIQLLSVLYPRIRFEVTNDGALLFQSLADGKHENAIYALYSKNDRKEFQKNSSITPDFQIEVYLGTPQFTRANKRHIYIFVNGRVIRHYGLSQTFIEAYGNLLHTNRFPVGYIFITCDPQLTDVNIHPTKQEVRISKEKELRNQLTVLVRETLNRLAHIKNAVSVTEKEELSPREFQQMMNTPFEERAQARTFDDSISLKEQKPLSLGRTIKEIYTLPEKQTEDDDTLTMSSNTEKVEDTLNTTIECEESTSQHDENREKDALFQEQVDPHGKQQFIETVQSFTIIGQVLGTYILCQNNDGMFLLDQHAVQERIKYEYYLSVLSQKKPVFQGALIPYTRVLSSEEQLKIDGFLKLLEAIGLRFSYLSETVLRLDEHDPFLKDPQDIDFIFERIYATETYTREALIHDLAVQMSCKKSIKANHTLTFEEMEQLLKDLLQCEAPYTCPHGRPVMIYYSAYDLAKLFSRT